MLLLVHLLVQKQSFVSVAVCSPLPISHLV